MSFQPPSKFTFKKVFSRQNQAKASYTIPIEFEKLVQSIILSIIATT